MIPVINRITYSISVISIFRHYITSYRVNITNLKITVIWNGLWLALQASTWIECKYPKSSRLDDSQKHINESNIPRRRDNACADDYAFLNGDCFQQFKSYTSHMSKTNMLYRIQNFKKGNKGKKKIGNRRKNLVHLLLTAVEEKTTVNISFITIILNNIQIHFNLTGIIKIPKMSLMISCFTARLPLHCINVTGLLDMI